MRAIVVGGGIAGATAALALRHIGIDVTIYEAYEEPAGDIGSFVSLASNGLRSLDTLGCLAQVQDTGVDIPRQRMWSAGGHLLADVPRGRRSTETLHSVTLLRGRLVAALRQAATDAGARIVTGRELVGVTETPEGVTAEFADGERATADLLVAADGIWSTVRRLLDAAAPRPEYAGLYAVSGVATMDGVEPGVFNLTFARNGAFIHLGAGDGEVWWQAQIAEPTQPDRTGISEAQWLSRTAELYQHEAVPSAVIAATTRLHPTVLFHAVDPVPTWHSDRVVLIGDAAHPVGAGQGASMAIEDALVLAAALQAEPTLSAALTAYDAERRPRIVKLLDTAEDNRGAKKAGPVKRRMQALVMRMFVPLFYEKATAWLYDYEPGTLGTR
ncbi:FAD-dependent oxidoreductase [Micromonospora parathelypteridis]|uniref:2-polyprenyl-6-methoxyphenol hydroxylase-like FAD-dependent oxidoreductase n=1 Tax=Micromonospora parathelypteridis TaxID=1839617 RepID=A0A840WBT0_9ACTN|nr:FAD-dependent monooxygenase [Micromonospora parathelypteridis]MBB5481629.1 2-polyprenyl-6-methoxyphenol hydroxylase-like FAD-dependent oxidoreductase [Micromonospora parathelypteridis]GGO28923.1 FAD-dependent oxidoreductase [Micromonospora parathelypteridis]